ncbi:MAG TPA: hypothetical protein VKF83_10435, partial [Stellaceae bacterium]|nr:hypothetical protein [Stellaceae bacterium]
MRRRTRRSAAGRDDILAPPPERRQHGTIEQLRQQIADSAGAIGRPFRAVDTLAAMERRGTITASMRHAAEKFRGLFRVARLDPLHAASLFR